MGASPNKMEPPWQSHSSRGGERRQRRSWWGAVASPQPLPSSALPSLLQVAPPQPLPPSALPSLLQVAPPQLLHSGGAAHSLLLLLLPTP